ncbi:MAG: hypothetical protein AB7T49_13280 [Oligoflexales bacterium]
MTALLQEHDGRRHPRMNTKRMPGYLIFEKTGEKVPCTSVDVSKYGIGILSPHWIIPDSELILVVPEGEIRLELVWGMLYQSQFYDNESSPENVCYKVYRYGLRLMSEDQDLAEIFSKLDCLDR